MAAWKSDSRFLMFTRLLASLTIGAMPIAAAFTMLTMLVLVTMLWLAIMLWLTIMFTVGTMVTLWFAIAVRLVGLMERHGLMNHRRSIASR